MAAPPVLFLSSGDLVADRRYAYAQDLAERGDLAAAADLMVQAAELAPAFASAWFALGDYRQRLGDRAGAIEAFRRARDADPDDRHGAGLRLARLGVTDAASTMTPDYVRAVFDQYAPAFDRALTDGLAYRGPQLLLDAVSAACGAGDRDMRFGQAVDLGCGTGLAGEVFRSHVDRLAGVDLSPGMVAQAHRKGCYDRLEVADMLAFLRGEPDGTVDLVMAADALVYVADLAPLFAAVSRVLAAAGLFAFTVETHDEQGVVLGEKLRYAHAEPYVRATLAAAGLAARSLLRASTRREGGVPVPGLVVVAARR